MKKTASKAFTLIEVLVVLTLASVIGSIMYSYFSMAVDHTSQPIEMLKESFDLNAVNENIAEDYENILDDASVSYTQWEPLTAYRIGDIVVSKSVRFGHTYRCIQAGFSGSGEPSWQTTVGNTIGDGDAVWEVRPGQLDEMIYRIREKRTGGQGTDNVVRDYRYYGRYGISYLGFIGFTEDEEVPVSEPGDPRNLLKLILKNDPGESITVLFSTGY